MELPCQGLSVSEMGMGLYKNSKKMKADKNSKKTKLKAKISSSSFPFLNFPFGLLEAETVATEN